MHTRFLRRFPYITLAFSLIGTVADGRSIDDVPLDPLSVEMVLGLALRNDPVLTWNEWEAESAAGQIDQTSRRPNPVVGAEVENLLGTGSSSGVDSLEITIGVRQEFETAGKREKRIRLAEHQRALIAWDREQRLVELESEVRSAFTEALLAQATVNLVQERLAVVNGYASELAQLVEAARSPEADLQRARLLVEQQALVLQQAERNSDAAKRRLVAFWNETERTDFHLAGEVSLAERMPSFAEVLARLEDSVALRRFADERAARQAALELERARAKPNFELFGGARFLNEGSGEGAIVLGAEVPWPVFDRNQGNIRSARARLRAVESERAMAHRSLLRELMTAHAEMSDAHAEANSVKERLLPVAEAGVHAAEQRYAGGHDTFLTVLESRLTLYEIKQTYLDALGRYAVARLKVERLARPDAAPR